MKIKYPLLTDAFSKKDLNAAISVIRSKKITMSKKTKNFEKKFAKSIGSTEIEPFTGGCELITDITSTGSTLAANNLRIINDGYILKSELCMFIGKFSFCDTLISNSVLSCSFKKLSASP